MITESRALYNLPNLLVMAKGQFSRKVGQVNQGPDFEINASHAIGIGVTLDHELNHPSEIVCRI